MLSSSSYLWFFLLGEGGGGTNSLVSFFQFYTKSNDELCLRVCVCVYMFLCSCVCFRTTEEFPEVDISSCGIDGTTDTPTAWYHVPGDEFKQLRNAQDNIYEIIEKGGVSGAVCV